MENIEQDELVDHENDELPIYPASYPPIPKVIVKEEITSEEDEDDCQLVAYAPLPYGPMKEESESEVGRDEHHSVVPVVSQSLTQKNSCFSVILFHQPVPQQERNLNLGDQLVYPRSDAQTGAAVMTNNTFAVSRAEGINQSLNVSCISLSLIC